MASFSNNAGLNNVFPRNSSNSINLVANECDFVDTTYEARMYSSILTAPRDVVIPDKSGTILLTRAKCYVGSIFGSGTTNITTQNVYVPMVLATSSSLLHNFTQNATGQLVYTGTVNDVSFNIQAFMSIKSNANNVNASIGIFKNSNIILGSEINNTMTTSPDVEHFSCSVCVDLSTGDTIQMYIKNTTGTQNLICSNFNFTAISLEIFNN